MEEMQKIAEAYYNAAPNSSKKVADDFVDEMAGNGDGNITLSVFLNFTREKNYSYISNPHFFNQLNLNCTGTLDRREAMTLFYIVNSGRPICIGCGKLITAIFFTCVKCFDGGDNDQSPTFDLCSSCFCAGSYCHGHNSFVDNFVLLQMKRRSENKMKREKRRAEEKRMKEIVNENVSSSFCQAIVPATGNHANQNIWQAAITGIVTGGAMIAHSLCTIM